MKLFMMNLQHDVRHWYRDLPTASIECSRELQEVFRNYWEDPNMDEDCFEDGSESIVSFDSS
jgi:hypothetical protein